MMRLSRILLALAVGGCSASHFDRDRMDKIVDRVRPLVGEPGKVYRFRVSDDLDPSSLAALPDSALLGRGDGRGVIRASVDMRHHIAVSIETRDDGHAGEYGVMFVDMGFEKAALEGVQRDSQHEERIDARWVRWHYDMD